jgi:transcriptional regulator with XRE-family HTH domain
VQQAMADIADKILKRRQQLGLRDVDVAKQSGIGIDAYWDIEHNPDELSITEISDIKKISEILDLDVIRLLEIQCDFCSSKTAYASDYRLPRNELIRKRRIERGLTTDKLGEEVGFYEIEIKRLENEPERIESWRLEFVQSLSESLGIPLPILLGVKCSQCGH